MGNIAYKPVDTLRTTIRESNESSTTGTQRYVFWENRAIHADYEFIGCDCTADCWCRRNVCTGHYRIRDIGFDRFLDTYVHLWVPPRARESVRNAVLGNNEFNGRQRNAVPPLQWLMRNWDTTLNRVRKHNKCGLCDSGTPYDAIVRQMYEAKMWSQLYYDSLVPFDTESCRRIIESGYKNPKRYYIEMNTELFADLRKLATHNELGLVEVRALDTPWEVDSRLTPIENGQPLSRVLDKIFYSPC